MIPRALAASLALFASSAAGQSAPPRPPVIDMHVHSTSTAPEEQLARMKALNIRYVWLAAIASDLPAWATAVPGDRFVTPLNFPCVKGRAAFRDQACWPGASDFRMAPTTRC